MSVVNILFGMSRVADGCGSCWIAISMLNLT